jgi:hypothetical protein
MAEKLEGKKPKPGGFYAARFCVQIFDTTLLTKGV